MQRRFVSFQMCILVIRFPDRPMITQRRTYFRPLVLALFCITCNLSDAIAYRSDTLRVVANDQLVTTSWSLYNRHIRSADSATAFAELNRIEAIAKERNSDLLHTTALFFKGKYCFERRLWAADKPLLYFLEASALEGNVPIMAAEIPFYIGSWYFFAKGDYPAAFEHMLKAHKAADDIGYDKLPNPDELLSGLANAYYQFGELDKTIKFLRQALSLPVSTERNLIEIYNTLGLCYRDREQYDTSVTYCLQALSAASRQKDTAWVGVITGNLGYIYYKLKRPEEALAYLFKDYHISSEKNQDRSAANAALLISQIYFEKGNKDSAAFMLQKGRDLVYATKDSRLYTLLYKDMAAFYRHQGDFANALKYTDSFISYKDKVAKENDVNALDKARNKAETEAHLADIRLLESESHKQLLIRNGIIFITILLVVAGWQIFRRLQERQRRNLEMLALQKRRSEEELENANALLNTYMESIRQKNKLIEQFTAELDQLHNAPDGPVAQEKIETLRKLQEATILTEDDWVNFKRVFTKVHPAFFIRLNDKFPTLTPAEIRIIALTKLGLSVKEKANMLGISPDSVRRTQQRLNKKLGMTEVQIFEELIPG